jgi:hypothetical protein
MWIGIVDSQQQEQQKQAATASSGLTIPVIHNADTGQSPLMKPTYDL